MPKRLKGSDSRVVPSIRPTGLPRNFVSGRGVDLSPVGFALSFDSRQRYRARNVLSSASLALLIEMMQQIPSRSTQTTAIGLCSITPMLTTRSSPSRGDR